MRRKETGGRFAERTLNGIGDDGAAEPIVIWIERKQGGVWAVGRAVDPDHRASGSPRRIDYVFEGYEMADALEHANATLRDDLRVLEQEGRPQAAPEFHREELLKPLERWFFGR